MATSAWEVHAEKDQRCHELSRPARRATRELSPSSEEISASIWRISLPSSTDWQRATTICGFSPISSDWSSRRLSISPISHQTAVRYQALRLLIHPHRILRVQSGEKAARSSVEGEQRHTRQGHRRYRHGMARPLCSGNSSRKRSQTQRSAQSCRGLRACGRSALRKGGMARTLLAMAKSARFKRGGSRANLVRAAALILAELERLKRQET